MKRVISLWLCFVLLASSAVVLGEEEVELIEGKVVVKNGVMYTTHAPMRIDSNAQFASMATAEGWNGSGMPGDPWVIENLNVSGSGNGNCIYVGNVSKHFIIQNCYLHNATGNSGAYRYNSGIVLYSTSNGTIHNSTISSCSNRGVYISESSHILISGNLIQLNGYGGIYLYHGTIINIDDNLILKNDIISFDSAGIRLHLSSFISITNNNISRGFSGIHLYYSSSNTISQNNISNVNYGANQCGGIYCENSQVNIIKLNNITNVNTGIWLKAGSNHNYVYLNYIKIEPFQTIGICMDFCSYDALWGNTLIAGGVSLCNDVPYWGDVSLFNTHTIPTNNTVNGKPIYYIKNQNGGKVPHDGGQVILANSRNMVVENITIIDRVFSPIQLYYSNYNLLQNNTLQWIFSVDDGCGISFYYSNYNILFNNTLIDYEVCIWLASSINNQIIHNKLKTEQCGIEIGYDSMGNVFTFNNISESYTAVIIFGSDNNLFYFNYFINNTDGYYIQNDAYGNKFHNGYPMGGNYWSDYMGVDNNHGINQDILGSDGLGDTPYGLDLYPLMPSSVQRPNIELISPLNNSLINSFTVIDFSIWERSLCILEANYSINGGPSQSLEYPYDIIGNTWPDGFISLNITAIDNNGYIVSKSYNFYKDSIIPTIILNNPLNNSISLPGTIIGFDIFDNDLKSVRYWKDGVLFDNFLPPYTISTIGWTDSTHQIKVSANDTHNNVITRIFYFTIDSLPPVVNIISPSNNSVISSGTILDFSVFEFNLQSVNFSINNGIPNILLSPYDLDTSGWLDGVYQVKVQALDAVGHISTKFLEIQLDSSSPIITLNSPSNNSLMRDRYPIDFQIDDDHLDTVTYTINGGSAQILLPPYDISTMDWTAGNYSVTIMASDLLNNCITKIFSFTFDEKPRIVLFTPEDFSIISPLCTLDFNIIDNQLINSNFSVDGNPFQIFSYPYDIFPTNWTDGIHSVTIIARDVFGETSDVYHFTVDSIPTNSSINHITQYWYSTSPMRLNITAYDTYRVANVSVWYRFSTDNITWATWSKWSTIAIGPWMNNFDFSDRHGYYEFYSIATDSAGNVESAPLIADACCAYDGCVPYADANENLSINIGTLVTFNGSRSYDNYVIGNYTWAFNDGSANLTLYGVSPTHIFNIAGHYIVTLIVHDAAGNSAADSMSITVNPSLDTDSDGIPDDQDAFLGDPAEWQDTDDDGIGNNADTDDDGDGYLDTWESFLGTDSLDPTDKPMDTDNDGIPDGDATNSQPWMDTDDDGDDIPDNEEIPPPVEEPNFIGDYWWLILLITIVAIIGLMVMRRKPQPIEVPKEEPLELQTELCPKCGFDIEKGAPCPFCAPEPPKPEPPKSSLSNQEKLERIEKAYREGQMTEEQYLRNVEKFSKK